MVDVGNVEDILYYHTAISQDKNALCDTDSKCSFLVFKYQKRK